MILWIAYILAAGWVDLIKIARYLRLQPPGAHKTFFGSVVDFYVGDNTATFTCVTTFSVELCLGAMYISRIGVTLIPWLDKIPLHFSFAALLGSLAAFFTPLVVKFIGNKFFPGVQ